MKNLKILPATTSAGEEHGSSLTAFISSMTAYADAQPLFKCYRGQRDARWPNIPGLFRSDLTSLADSEKRAVRDLVSVHPGEFATDETMFDRLVRMQHFGLPTRLMDVSQNPLVALYFATDPGPAGEESDGAVTAFAVPEEREKYFDSDAISCLANLANMTAREKVEIVRIRQNRAAGTKLSAEIARINDEPVYQRLHQFIRAEKPHFLPIINSIDLFKPYYVHPKMSNRRILSQAGGFIIYGLTPTKKINFAHPITETKFVIPKDAKGPLRKALELLGISDSTLFPELDRAANRIKARYST
ncbi:FRG domain-containing protein [Brevundimonas diminuta]|uniref:FRG domain-containing protein n=1 Tax=Brevundimonas diminuta TaxID=293 RepID=UPI003207A0EF